MRVLILDTYYPRFLRSHYAARPGLDRDSYAVQRDALMARSFGASDAYSVNLCAQGHDAAEQIVNCVPLQARWAAEHGLRSAAGLLKWFLERGGRLAARVTGAMHRIVLAQVEDFAPDVIYLQDLGFHTTAQVRELRGKGRLVVGQIATMVPPRLDEHLRAFDLVTTSFPHYVERFRALGVDTEYLPIGFDERVLARLEWDHLPRSDILFIGGLDPRVWREGVEVLEQICSQFGDAVSVYGYAASRVPKSSPLREHYRGEAWGVDMYRLLAGARITVNRHGGVAGGYSNNMRLYEATGVGTALLTDRGRNLGELFDEGREIATYRDAGEAVAATRELLDNESKRRALAAAGQARTLAEHTYAQRMRELAAMLEERVNSRSRVR